MRDLNRKAEGVGMPVARYFLRTVLLALLFIADACSPKLPLGRMTETPTPVIAFILS
jgi:hypothetical protein